MRLFFLLIFTLLTTISNGQSMEAYFNLTRFDIPGEKPFIDVFISFNGRSVHIVEGKASIESTILIKNGEHIIDFRKTKVESELLTADSIPMDFVDVQRFPIKNGKYSIEVMLKDLFDPREDTLRFSYPFELFFSGSQVEVSDIELIDRIEQTDKENLFSKGGRQLIPFVSDYFDESRNEIKFYCEIYNTKNKFGSESKYLVVAQITNSGGEVIDNYRQMLRKESSSVEAILSSFDITDLYSGTYNLQIEVRDTKNELIKENKFQFFRNKSIPFSELDTLNYVMAGEVLFTQMIPDREVLLEYLRSMWPRGEQLERNIIDNQLSSSTTEQLQDFMYTFWYKRNPEFPQEEWDKYYDMVKLVNQIYGTQIRKGYETDRGRVFLQYGKPNKLVEVPREPSAYPYEIWQYYHIGQYSNIRFVFYNKDLSTNDYSLLHSDLRGEVYNRRWEAEIYSRTTPMDNIDNNNADPHMGGRARDYYNNPR